MNDKEFVFIYHESDFNAEKDDRRVAFELFVKDLIENHGYNPETDQIDIKTVFEKYVWRS